MRNENYKKIILFYFVCLFSLVNFSIAKATKASYKTALVPSDTFFAKQWHLKRINAPDAWDISKNAKSVLIAIIDSGVQINHPDLRDKIWINTDEIANNKIDDDGNGYIDDYNGWDFVNHCHDPNPKFTGSSIESEVSHGTIIAGIAAASGNNNEGVSGISWNAKIMPLRALNDKGVGTVSNIVAAISYAIKNGADIINLSFAGSAYSAELNYAVEEAHKAGILIVAAAGNDDMDKNNNGNYLNENPMYPVCNDGVNGENMVLGVAATNALDQKTSFSGYGTNCIDISAPGVSIYSTSFYAPTFLNGKAVFDKEYDGFWSGTSMAVPMVSAAAALVMGVNPSLNKKEVTTVLQESAENIEKLNPSFKGMLGSGRLDVYAAINKAKSLLFSHSNAIVLAGQSNKNSEIVIKTKKGKLKNKFFAYDKNFRGGVNVSAGDIDGDGRDEIITAPANKGGPQVRIFNSSGKVLGQFFAYDKNFRGGVNVSLADIDGGTRKRLEIITSPARGGGPQIRIFKDNGDILHSFFAFKHNFHGGVSISTADTNNNGLSEIICGAGKGGTPHLRIFSTKGKLLNAFYAFETEFRGGINITKLKYY